MRKFRLKLFLLFGLILGVSFGYSCFAGMFGDVLQDNGLKTDEVFTSVPGKAIVTDLYKTTLKQIKTQEFKPVSDSITTTKDVLNKKYACSLTEEDLVNIMYDNTLKGTILDQIAEEQSEIKGQKLVAPTKKAIETGCIKLISCRDRIPPKKITIGPSLASTCNDEVSKIYYMANDVNSAKDTFNDENFGTETFKNGSLDDSDYDLITDIQNIGKLMFEGFKPPVQILYYKLPDLVNTPGQGVDASNQGNLFSNGSGYQDQSYQPDLNLVCEIGYYLSSDKSKCCKVENGGNMTCEMVKCKDGLILYNGKCLMENDVVTNELVFVDIGVDTTTQGFLDGIQSSTEGAANYGSILPSNSCMTSGSPTGPTTIITEVTTATDYDPKEVCEAGYVMEVTMKKCCPIGSTDVNECKNPSCDPSSGVYDKDKNKCFSAFDSNHDGTIDAQEMSVQAENYGNSLGQSIDNLKAPPNFGDCNQECDKNSQDSGDVLAKLGKPFKELGCEKDCCDVKCKDLPLSQKVLCTAQCLCTTVSSPTFDPIKHPGLDSIFKIQMCMIAPVPIEVTRGKAVKSIEEIFNEIKAILYSIKDGGKMTKTVKTKELMDSSMKKVKFGERFSFSLILKRKPLFPNVKDTTKVEKAKENNKTLQDIYYIPGRNKYVVLGDPARIKAQVGANGIMSNLNAEITKFTDTTYSDPVYNTTAFDTAEKLRSYTIVNEEILSFLEKNILFWRETKGVFDEINDISIIMGEKVFKAE